MHLVGPGPVRGRLVVTLTHRDQTVGKVPLAHLAPSVEDGRGLDSAQRVNRNGGELPRQAQRIPAARSE
jgi:hypothetical protein